MNLRNHVRTLAMASLLALAVVSSVPVGQAHARQKIQGAGVYCVFKDSTTGDYTFFMPGEILTVSVNGKFVDYICDANGNWRRLAMVSTPPPGPEGPLPVGNAPTTQPSPTGPVVPLPVGGMLAP